MGANPIQLGLAQLILSELKDLGEVGMHYPHSFAVASLSSQVFEVHPNLEEQLLGDRDWRIFLTDSNIECCSDVPSVRRSQRC